MYANLQTTIELNTGIFIKVKNEERFIKQTRDKGLL